MWLSFQIAHSWIQFTVVSLDVFVGTYMFYLLLYATFLFVCHIRCLDLFSFNVQFVFICYIPKNDTINDFIYTISRVLWEEIVRKLSFLTLSVRKFSSVRKLYFWVLLSNATIKFCFPRYCRKQITIQILFLRIYIHTLYCQKYWVPPFNERFDYFSNFHEYKS